MNVLQLWPILYFQSTGNSPNGPFLTPNPTLSTTPNVFLHSIQTVFCSILCRLPYGMASQRQEPNGSYILMRGTLVHTLRYLHMLQESEHHVQNYLRGSRGSLRKYITKFLTKETSTQRELWSLHIFFASHYLFIHYLTVTYLLEKVADLTLTFRLFLLKVPVSLSLYLHLSFVWCTAVSLRPMKVEDAKLEK